MIKELIISVIGIAFLSVACEMIMPEGKMKKYYKLVIGFILMCVLMQPLSSITEFKEFEFSLGENITEEELLAESEAYILKFHEENIKNHVLDMCSDGTEVFVDLYSDGLVKSVVIRGNIAEGNLAYLKKELGCENITVKNGDLNEN